MSAAKIIREHWLQPHPFEGYWRELRHEPGVCREGLQLFEATDEAGWHRIDAEVTYRLLDGGPLALSMSPDGHEARAERLTDIGQATTIAPGVLRAISCLGAYALMELTFRPDRALTDRELMPDDWFPEPRDVKGE